MHQEKERVQLTMATGMTAGILVAVLASILIHTLTGDDAIWVWSIPIGIAVGAAAGAGSTNREQEKKNGGEK